MNEVKFLSDLEYSPKIAEEGICMIYVIVSNFPESVCYLNDFRTAQIHGCVPR